jgi:hypothetical protein
VARCLRLPPYGRSSSGGFLLSSGLRTYSRPTGTESCTPTETGTTVRQGDRNRRRPAACDDSRAVTRRWRCSGILVMAKGSPALSATGVPPDVSLTSLRKPLVILPSWLIGGRGQPSFRQASALSAETASELSFGRSPVDHAASGWRTPGHLRDAPREPKVLVERRRRHHNTVRPRAPWAPGHATPVARGRSKPC